MAHLQKQMQLVQAFKAGAMFQARVRHTTLTRTSTSYRDVPLSNMC
jgi:hypothetical protein